MDVRIALQHLKARQGEVAKDGLERHIRSEDKKLDEKTKLNTLLDAADQLAADGSLTYMGGPQGQSDLAKLNRISGDAKMAGPGWGASGDKAGYKWDATNDKYDKALIGNPDDASDERANANKTRFDGWKKTVTRKLEALDDGQAVAQIKLQQLNNTMLNSEGARTDLQKQTHDLDKKIRDNIYTSSV